MRAISLEFLESRRLLSAGSFDRFFASGGILASNGSVKATDLTTLDDGRVVTVAPQSESLTTGVGEPRGIALMRFRIDGQIDRSFSDGDGSSLASPRGMITP